MIQKQTWKDEIRILITDEENHGSVQISIPLYVSDIFGKADALIYALWVDVVYRRNGVAQRLLQLAEQQAKLNGVKTIGLEFVKDESDRFVLDWYLRSQEPRRAGAGHRECGWQLHCTCRRLCNVHLRRAGDRGSIHQGVYGADVRALSVCTAAVLCVRTAERGRDPPLYGPAAARTGGHQAAPCRL